MSAYKLKNFPTDNNFWRIDWLGILRPNRDVESDPTIDVHLSKLAEGYVDALSNASLAGQQRRISVGVGYLPLLKAGSVWRNGYLHAYPGTANAVRFELDTTAGKLLSLNAKTVIDGSDRWLVPPRYYPLGSHYRDVASAPIFVFSANDGKFDYYIIPAFELLRFYYVCSSKTAHYVFHNSLDQAINPTKSAILRDRDIRLHLRRDIADREAFHIARWFASDVMRKQVSSFRRIRTVQAANQNNHEPMGVHPYIGFPFEGRTTLRAVGKRLQLDGGNDSLKSSSWAFLVLNILNCAHPLPYRDIILDRDNSGTQGKNQDASDLLPAWNHADKIRPDGNSDTPDLLLASDEEPDKKLQRDYFEQFEQQFEVSNHRIIKEEKEVQKYRSASVIQSGEIVVYQYGTGDGTYGETTTGPISVSTTQLSSSAKPPITLKLFLAALKWLRDNETVQSVTTLPLGSRHMLMEGEAIYLFPSRIKGKKSWHLMGENSGRARAAVIARIAVPGKIVYVLELERKGDGNEYATLVLANELKNEIHDEEHRQFLLATARKSRWPIEGNSPNLRMKRVGHRHDDDGEKFGRRLLKAAKSV